MHRKRVIVLGLDGASWALMNRMIELGAMPHTEYEIANNAIKGILESTHPPVTPPAWASITTGVNPGKHGIFGFGYMDNGRFIPYTSKNMVREEAIWDMLTIFNKKVILLNVPWTYPPFKVNGIMITGPPSPRNIVRSYPTKIISEIESFFVLTVYVGFLHFSLNSSISIYFILAPLIP